MTSTKSASTQARAANGGTPGSPSKQASRANAPRANPAAPPRRQPRRAEYRQSDRDGAAGRVNVSPEKAIEMAGKLYGGRQVSPGRTGLPPDHRRTARANADAHNILGVTLAASGKIEEAIDSLQARDQDRPNAASYHANLGEVLRQAGRVDEAGKR